MHGIPMLLNSFHTKRQETLNWRKVLSSQEIANLPEASLTGVCFQHAFKELNWCALIVQTAVVEP